MFRLLRLTSLTYSLSAATRNYREIKLITNQEEELLDDAETIISAVEYAYTTLKDRNKREYYKKHGKPGPDEPYNNEQATSNTVLMNRLLNRHRHKKFKEGKAGRSTEKDSNNGQTSNDLNGGEPQQLRISAGNAEQNIDTNNDIEVRMMISFNKKLENKESAHSKASNVEKNEEGDEYTEEVRPQYTLTQMASGKPREPNQESSTELAKFVPLPLVDAKQTKEEHTQLTGDNNKFEEHQTKPITKLNTSESTPKTTRTDTYSKNNKAMLSPIKKSIEIRSLEENSLSNEYDNDGMNEWELSLSSEGDTYNNDFYIQDEHTSNETYKMTNSTIRKEMVDAETSTYIDQLNYNKYLNIVKETRDIGTSPIKFTDEFSLNGCVCGSARRTLSFVADPLIENQGTVGNQPTTSNNKFNQSGRSSAFEKRAIHKQYIEEILGMRTRDRVTSFKVKWGPGGEVNKESASVVMEEQKGLRNWLTKLNNEQPKRYISILKYHPEFYTVLVDYKQ